MINILLNTCYLIAIFGFLFEMGALTILYAMYVQLKYVGYPNIRNIPDKLFDKEDFKPWKGILHQ